MMRLRCYMPEIRTKIGEGGRIVLPAEYRKALGLKPGDEVVLVLREGEVRLLTPKQAILGWGFPPAASSGALAQAIPD